MKRAIISGCLVFLTLVSGAQSWNLFVNQGIVSPSPLLPMEFGGSGEVSFNIGNTGISPINFDKENPENNVSLTIFLKNNIPDKNNPVSAIGGSWKSYFDWSYNPADQEFTAVQKRTIPGDGQGTITVGFKVGTNTPYTAASNGFMIKLKAPSYIGISNNTQDDAVSSYTYTQAYDYGDAPSSYGMARHEINVIRDPLSGLYTKYIMLGTKEDQEPDDLSSPDGEGDDKSGNNDDDGVIFPVLKAGTTVIIPVVVTAFDESNGILNAWFDWNGDGDFTDAGEKVPVTPMYVYSSGTYNLSVAIPENAVTDKPTFARFRIGANSGPSAPNSWGEAEDYRINILSPESKTIAETISNGALQTSNVVLRGDRNGSEIKLTWETLTERNAKWFIVEKSTDGEQFRKVGTEIVAIGNSVKASQYTFVDKEVNNEIVIYRIRLIGSDNSEKLSNSITEILDNMAPVHITVYPNPVLDKYYVKIDKSGSYFLELMDVSGRVVSRDVMQVGPDGNGIKQLSKGTNVQGSYFMRITDKNSGLTRTVKLIMVQQNK